MFLVLYYSVMGVIGAIAGIVGFVIIMYWFIELGRLVKWR